MDEDRLVDTDEPIGPDTEVAEGRANETRQSYDQSRSPVAAIFDGTSRQVLVEWACDAYANEDETFYNKSELSEKTGLSRQTIYDNVDTLVDFGILETEGEARKRYRPNTETEFCGYIIQLNNALLAFYNEH